MNIAKSEYKILKYFVKKQSPITLGSIKKHLHKNTYLISLYTLNNKGLIAIENSDSSPCDSDKLFITPEGEITCKEFAENLCKERKQYILNNIISFFALIVSILALIKSCWNEISYFLQMIIK